MFILLDILRAIRVAQTTLRPWQKIAGLFVLTAVCARLWLSKQLDANWTLGVHGLLGDTLLAVFLTTAVILTIRWRFVVMLIILLWAILTIISTEHIYALDAPLRLENYRFALQTTFWRGSAFNFLTWVPMLATVGGALIIIFAICRRATPSKGIVLCAAVLFVVSGATLWRHALFSPDWRQANPIAMSFAKQFTNHTPANAALANAAAFFRNEVNDGSPVGIGNKPDKPNVLLIVLEGLPGVYLRQVQRQTGVQTPIDMPKLSDIADAGLIVPNFITHGNGTIGGLYALLCGDYVFINSDETIKPHLIPSLPADNRPQCLPQKLANAGYHTAFMQAADLKYMEKNIVMPLLGFDEISGKQENDESLSDSFWGVDDNALLQRALQKIDDLRTAKKPWFLSLLTVGTHHPFLAPADYLKQYDDPKKAAVRFLDDSLANFIQALKERGVPEDTLIIITSDESHGVPGHPFGEHWGLNAIIGAGVKARIADGIFGQIDLAASVLDYLGFDNTPMGRSVFRQYDNPRHILFGEFATFDNAAISCRADFCQRYQLNGGKLFAPDYRISNDDSKQNIFHTAFAQAANFYGKGNRQRLFLAQDIVWEGSEQDLLSKKIILPERSRIEVLLDVKNNDTRQIISPAFYLLNNKDGIPIGGRTLPKIQLPALLPQSRLLVHYAFSNPTRTEAQLLFRAFQRDKTTPLGNIGINKIQLLTTPINTDEVLFKMNKFVLEYPPDVSRQFGAATVFAKHFKPIREGSTAYTEQTQASTDAYFIPIRYRIGDKISYAATDNDWRALFMLAGDWSYPEPWGVWSSGEDPSLAFQLDDVPADGNYEMLLEILPHIAQQLNKTRQISFILNGEDLGTLTFTEQKIIKRGIVIPAAKLHANAINTLTFKVKTPFSPATYNVADAGFERLGLAILSFQIRPL